MKFTDRLAIGSLAASILSIVIATALSLYVFSKQNNIDFVLTELAELKELRGAVIDLVVTNGVCMYDGELTEIGGKKCTKFGSAKEPLEVAAGLRLVIYKKLYLFDDELKKAMGFDVRPLSENSFNSYEMDGDEFITYVDSTIGLIDLQIERKRKELE